jgi:secreted trypsin-like serine protease
MRRFLTAFAAITAAAVPALPSTAAAAQGPTAAPATASVIGGHAASIAEFPSLAFIAGKDREGPFSCTGAVVAPRVVLTAGHCVQKPGELATNPPASFRVVTGTADLRTLSAANLSSVARGVFYPTFETAKVQVDAGLLVLSAPTAAPALPLARGADAGLLDAGTVISIAGWGLTDPQAKNAPSVLQAGELVLKSQSFCRRGTRSFESFYSPLRQLCSLDTLEHQVSGCFGDSGGPAIARRANGTPVEVGIVVSGGAECSRRLPNIYTNVEKIAAWVTGWIATVEAGAPTPPVPRASPPLLTFERAKKLGALALAKVFHSRFRTGVDKRASCVRDGWAKVRCRVAWRLGGQRFHGSFTIHLVVRGYRVVPRASVRVRSS